MQDLNHDIHSQHDSLSGPSLPPTERIPLGMRGLTHSATLNPSAIDQLLGDPHWLEELMDSQPEK